jgi:hypothetical protein
MREVLKIIKQQGAILIVIELLKIKEKYSEQRGGVKYDNLLLISWI